MEIAASLTYKNGRAKILLLTACAPLGDAAIILVPAPQRESQLGKNNPASPLAQTHLARTLPQPSPLTPAGQTKQPRQFSAGNPFAIDERDVETHTFPVNPFGTNDSEPLDTSFQRMATVFGSVPNEFDGVLETGAIDERGVETHTKNKPLPVNPFDTDNSEALDTSLQRMATVFGSVPNELDGVLETDTDATSSLDDFPTDQVLPRHADVWSKRSTMIRSASTPAVRTLFGVAPADAETDTQTHQNTNAMNPRRATMFGSFIPNVSLMMEDTIMKEQEEEAPTSLQIFTIGGDVTQLPSVGSYTRGSAVEGHPCKTLRFQFDGEADDLEKIEFEKTVIVQDPCSHDHPDGLVVPFLHVVSRSIDEAPISIASMAAWRRALDGCSGVLWEAEVGQKLSAVLLTPRKHSRVSEAIIANTNDGYSFSPKKRLALGASAIPLLEDETAHYKTLQLNDMLRDRATEYTTEHNITVRVGTFNVNGKPPKNDQIIDLTEWLTGAEIPKKLCDIVAIGFEELDLSKETFIRNNSTHEEMWTPSIQAALMGIEDYTKLVSKQLVGILLVIYVKTKLLPNISNVVTASTGTGIMGMMGNKGGVTIRFDVFASSVCFTCAHLAAGPDQLERRNHDYAQIMTKTELEDDFGSTWEIEDHDIIFFFGDLNYRVTEIPFDEVVARVRNGTHLTLLKSEQLTSERRQRQTFVGFSEAPILFKPTYKFEPGTDLFTNKKDQQPSWCDRVLYKGKVECTKYTSHPYIQISDHKPVSGVYTCKIIKVDEAKKQVVIDQSLRDLDAIENQSMPDATVSTNNLTFGTVRYLEEQEKTVTIQNTGKVPVRFSFKNKPREKRACKPWLSTLPSSGSIAVGQAITITFTIHVDSETAAELNTGKDTIDDIVVLSLLHGKELFISVAGAWRRTCFCTSLRELVKMDATAASIAPGPVIVSNSLHSIALEDTMVIPKELWILVDHLLNASTTDDAFTELFFVAASTTQLLSVINNLDVGGPLKNTNIHAVAEAFVRLLDSFPESVIPPSEHKKCINARSTFAAARQVIHQLPHRNQYMFLYTTSFLRCMVDRQSSSVDDVIRQNHAEALRGKLALLFSTVLLKPADQSVRISNSLARKQAQFIGQFLNNDDAKD